jgi:hypothetical protein
MVHLWVHLPEDILLDLCIRFLDIADIGALISVDKHMHLFSQGKNFWGGMVRHRIAPVMQCPYESSAVCCANVKESLDFPDSLSLFRTLHKISCPLSGFWMLHSEGAVRGNLIRIYSTSSKEYMLSQSRKLPELIKYDASTKSLMHKCTDHHGEKNSWTAMQLCSDSSGIMCLVLTDLKHPYYPVPYAAPPTEEFAYLASCVGLFTSFYGPHGREIIATSMERMNSTFKTTDAEILSLCGPNVLYGLKVTGDENVPAGTLTFIVAAAERLDIAVEAAKIGLDSVIYYDDDQGIHSSTTLREREHDISHWLKGRLQTNSTPGTWAPEWREMNLLIYNQGEQIFSLFQSRVVYSMFYQSHGYIYMLDFVATNNPLD